jgi:hypothetical protein
VEGLSAISGWAITLLAILCSLVPTEAIANIWIFEGKLAAGTLAVVASAWLVYRRAEHSLQRFGDAEANQQELKE